MKYVTNSATDGDPIWIVGDDNDGRWYGRHNREKREISEMKKNAR